MSRKILILNIIFKCFPQCYNFTKNTIFHSTTVNTLRLGLKAQLACSQSLGPRLKPQLSNIIEESYDTWKCSENFMRLREPLQKVIIFPFTEQEGTYWTEFQPSTCVQHVLKTSSSTTLVHSSSLSPPPFSHHNHCSPSPSSNSATCIMPACHHFWQSTHSFSRFSHHSWCLSHFAVFGWTSWSSPCNCQWITTSKPLMHPLLKVICSLFYFYPCS